MKNNILIWSRSIWRLCLKHRRIILALLVLGGCFYWFEWRPAEIKKECSYVPYKVEAVTELTQETIDKEKADLDACVRKYPTIVTKGVPVDINRPSGRLGEYFDSLTSEKMATQCESMPNSYGEIARSASPARIEYRDANLSEYNFCLHSRGL